MLAMNIERLEELANKGDAESQYKLALYYLDEKGDAVKGKHYLEMSVSNGWPDALGYLGELLYEEKLYDKALILLNRAVDKSPKAKYVLAKMYRDGFGVVRDKRRYTQMMQDAASAGEKSAQLYLALSYFNGEDGFIKDLAEAEKWALKASGHREDLYCYSEYPYAHALLGKIYEAMGDKSLFMRKRKMELYGKAKRCFLIAIIRGFEDAALDLGLMYSKGFFGSRKEAVSCLTMAVAHGVPGAEKVLKNTISWFDDKEDLIKTFYSEAASSVFSLLGINGVLVDQLCELAVELLYKGE